MADEVVTTELVIDARGAIAGTAEYEAALRVAQNAVDRLTASQEKQRQASKAAGDAASGSAEKIDTSTRAFSSAERAANSYLARLDPLINGQQAVGKELTAAQSAMAGLDKQVLSGAINLQQYNERTALLQGRLGELKTAQAGLAAGTLSVNDAMKLTSTQAEIASRATTNLSASHTALAGSSKSVQFAMRDLGLQSIDLFQGLATGQPVFRTLIQQGSQVIQVNSAMGVGFRETAAGVASFIGGLATNPLVLFGAAATAVVGGLVIFGTVAENAGRRIEGLRNELSLVRNDYIATSAAADQAAKSLAATSILTTVDARAGINAIYTNPNFQGTQQQAKDTALAFAQFSKALQETTPNWIRLQEAMTDPAALMQKLLDQNHLVGLTDEFVRHIKTLQDTGQGYKATAQAIDFITTAVSHVKENETPLEKALHDLSQAFTKTGQDGKTFAESLGGPIVKMAADVVAALASIATKIQEMNSQAKAGGGPSLGQFIMQGISPMLPGGLLSQYFGSGSSSSPQAGPTVASASIAPFLQAAAQAEQIDAALLTRLQQAEGVYANGSWQMSPTGAIGPMQVTGSTFRGMQRQPGAFPSVSGLTDLNDPGQNVTAGAALFGHLLRKYGDPSLAVLAYHDGETLIDQVLASGGAQSPSAAGLAEARRVLSGYTGTGLASGSTTTLPPIDVTATRLAAGDNRGFVENTDKTIADATKLADSFGVAASKARTAQENVDLLNAALAKTGLSKPVRDELNEALQQAYVNLYNAIGPAAQLVRTTDLQTAAELRVADAWKLGAGAAADLAIKVKAENDALQFAAPGTRQYADITDTLTAAYKRKAAASERAKLAEAGSVTRDQIALIQLQTDTLGMNNDAREALIAHMKNEQDVARQFPNVSQNEREARVRDLDQVAAMTQALQEQQNALNTLANMFSQAFDTIGNAITQALVSGQGAAVNWRNVMTAVAQQVLQAFLKLSILNPLLNSLFGQNQATLDQVLTAVGSAGGGSGSGTGTGGGTSLIGMASTGGSVLSGGSSILQALGYQGLGGQVNSLLGGPGTSLFAGTGIGEGGITGLASTSLYGGSTVTMGGELGGLGASATVGGATLGSLVGGVGGGFALGSLLGAGEQKLLNKTGPAPMIGAGVGALAGAAIGSFIPGFGTVLGGIAGGSIGKNGGGFIGRKKAA